MSENEKIKEYANLVRDMRKAQKLYFRSRDTKVLEQSKELERKVDEATGAILGEGKQGTLM